MANLLPNQIPPFTQLFMVDGHNDKTWWLLFYNLVQAVLGNDSASAAAFIAQTNADLNSEIGDTDPLGLIQRVSNIEKQIESQYPVISETLYASDAILPDPVPRAQPVQIITPGASPYVYTALQDGQLLVTAGTISGFSISRDGVTFYPVGYLSGPVSMSRLDRVTVTYSGLPTMIFFPR